jgi:hypothetical protein
MGSRVSTPAAGWYPDPGGSGRQRYWDGTAWTQHLRPPEAAAAADVPGSGWYPDPAGSGAERWWDGTAWTTSLREVGAEVAAADPDPVADPDPAADPDPVVDPEPAAEPAHAAAAAHDPDLQPASEPEPEAEPSPPAGWYPDPTDPARERRWDGTAWTEDLRDRTVEPAAGRSRRGRLIAASVAAVLVVGGVVVAWQQLGAEDDAVAAGTAAEPDDASEPPQAPVDEVEEPVAEEPVVDEAVEEEPELFGATGGSLASFHAADAELLVDVGQGPLPVALSDGTGELEDGRGVRLVEELAITGDTTGDGAEESVAVLAVEHGVSDAELPALAVIAEHPDAGAHPLPPPRLVVPWRTTPWSTAPGLVDGIGIVAGGIELGLVAPAIGSNDVVLDDSRADPLSGNRRHELRLEYDAVAETWQPSADGPLTRLALDVARGEGYTPETLVCDGRVDARGQLAACRSPRTFDEPDELEVVLLAVDDDGGVRVSLGDPDLVNTATQVRTLMGPGEHLCRDLLERDGSDPFVWDLPFAAIAYWFDQGMPDRMDQAQNGIPCETVWDGIAAFLDGSDARLTETYAITPAW